MIDRETAIALAAALEVVAGSKETEKLHFETYKDFDGTWDKFSFNKAMMSYADTIMKGKEIYK